MGLRTSFLGLVAAVLLLASLVSADTLTTIVPPEADAFVYSNDPNGTYGNTANLVCAGTVPYAANSYLTFDVSSAVPAGRVFQSATLWLYYDNNWFGPPPFTVNAHEVTAAWVEATITWNNQPGFAAPIVDSTVFPSGASFGWYSWDLTSIWPGTGKLRTALETSADQRGPSFPSREATSQPGRRPYLEVTHTPEPGALAVLALGLGAALLRRRRRN